MCIRDSSWTVQISTHTHTGWHQLKNKLWICNVAASKFILTDVKAHGRVRARHLVYNTQFTSLRTVALTVLSFCLCKCRTTKFSPRKLETLLYRMVFTYLQIIISFCHNTVAIRANIDWKSPFLKRVGHFGPIFLVEGDVPHQLFVHGWIGQWLPYNFAAESFHTKKLCSRLSSRKPQFFIRKMEKSSLSRTPLEVRGNVRCSS